MTDARLIDFDDSVYMGRPTTTATTKKRSEEKRKYTCSKLFTDATTLPHLFSLYTQTDREEKRREEDEAKRTVTWLLGSSDQWLGASFRYIFDGDGNITFPFSLFPNLSHLALCSRPLISISQPRKKNRVESASHHPLSHRQSFCSLD